MLDQIRLRRISGRDLPDCLALARDRGWPPEEHKWRLLLDLGTGYGLRNQAGELVGTTILTRYGTSLAVISMVLVAARYGQQGLGRRLMTHALAQVSGPARTVFLNATWHGRPLYERLGFVPVDTTHTFIGTMTPATPEPTGSRPAVPADLPGIRRLDAAVNGADRPQLVERLPSFCERVRVVERGGAITSYAGAWRNVDSMVVGPVIAETVAEAQLLINDVVAGIADSVRLDLDDRYPLLQEWATQRGLTERSRTAVMVHGSPLPGDRRRWFVPLMQALG